MARKVGTGTSRPSNAGIVVAARRVKEEALELGDHLIGGVAQKLGTEMRPDGGFGWVGSIPSLPRFLVRNKADGGAWPEPSTETPEELRLYAATKREPDAEAAAFAASPMPNFVRDHGGSVLWLLRRSWAWLLPTQPRVRRSMRSTDAARRFPVAAQRAALAPAELSARVKSEAERLGFSTVGFAMADPRYTFAGYEVAEGERVIVCILEQDWNATQTAPSTRAERSAMTAYARLETRVADLVEFLKGLGYEARPNSFGSLEAVAIHYGEQAGLGQLGLNGQLLTPAAGSRARLALITTEAPLEPGTPVDYGVPALCNECQLCVRRCPPGAIPKARKSKRGVVKASIKPERCMPVVAQAHGCAVCMKVCPVQRYGLTAVQDHYVATGTILGKGSDELEGYIWPLDGRYYGPGEKPQITSDFINPSDWPFGDETTGGALPDGSDAAAPEMQTSRD